jgi:2-oxoglutaroyl-CoA hydrolase
VILDRPPLNIVTMAEREELRAVFEALDADARIRVVVLRAAGEHFSSGGEISGFLEASPEHVSRLAWNIGTPARCRQPVIAASPPAPRGTRRGRRARGPAIRSPLPNPRSFCAYLP